MTEKQYKDAQNTIGKIMEITKKINDLEKLKNRVHEITGEYQHEIQIQIAEGYMYTPQPLVKLHTLIDYIDGEINYYKTEKDELEKEFSEI